MSPEVAVAVVAAVGPTLAGVAALVQSTRARREAAAVNRAVNHVDPGQPTLYQHAQSTSQKLDTFVEYQHGRNHEVGNALAVIQAKAALLEMKVTEYMETDTREHHALRVEIGRIADQLGVDAEVDDLGRGGDIDRRRG